MDNNFLDPHTRVGTVGGTLLVLLLQVRTTDMLRTAVLALIGATVSFVVSLLLKTLVKWVRKHNM